MSNFKLFLYDVKKMAFLMGDAADVVAHQCDMLEAAASSMKPYERRVAAEILRQMVSYYLEGSHFKWEPEEDLDFKWEVVYLEMVDHLPRLKEADLNHWEEVIEKPFISWEARQHAASKEAAEEELIS